jgi:hypothetical protein
MCFSIFLDVESPMTPKYLYILMAPSHWHSHFPHYISVVSVAAFCHAAATDHAAQKPRPVFIIESIDVSQTAFVSKGQQELIQGGH